MACQGRTKCWAHGCWPGILQCTISDSVKFSVLNTFLQYLTLKIFKFTGPVNIAPFLRFRFGNNCEIQSEIVLLWTGILSFVVAFLCVEQWEP